MDFMSRHHFIIVWKMSRVQFVDEEQTGVHLTWMFHDEK